MDKAIIDDKSLKILYSLLFLIINYLKIIIFDIKTIQIISKLNYLIS